MTDALFTLHEGFRPEALISTASNALVALQPGSDYVLKPRTYGDIVDLLHGDYHTVGLTCHPADVLYAGAESATRPNITVFPATWPARHAIRVLPTSLGHYQADPSKAPLAFLEV